eukprot:TRINITY_DN4587_c0_g1_i4.p4 TRINITY_DN4587_c0_g1~~TRINITY_DN4587_c0_g1_i4.p4  ORF type:complete len:101 (-),score=2.43 TRINITY_DN4587_c0_g1_i4:102-404(-)
MIARGSLLGQEALAVAQPDGVGVEHFLATHILGQLAGIVARSGRVRSCGRSGSMPPARTARMGRGGTSRGAAGRSVRHCGGDCGGHDGQHRRDHSRRQPL